VPFKTDQKTNAIIKNEDGVILLEFAFLVIILIVLVLGFVTVFSVGKDYLSIHKVAREGAREAAITGNENSGYARAYQAAWLWKLKPENLAVELSQTNEGTRTFESCSVTYRTNLFNYTFPTVVGQSPLADFDLHTNAIFGWWDLNK